MSTVFIGSSLPKDAREGDIWIADLWAQRMVDVLNPLNEARQKRLALQQWVRASLEADISPEWLIEMVTANILSEFYAGALPDVLPPTSRPAAYQPLEQRDDHSRR